MPGKVAPRTRRNFEESGFKIRGTELSPPLWNGLIEPAYLDRSTCLVPSDWEGLSYHLGRGLFDPGRGIFDPPLMERDFLKPPKAARQLNCFSRFHDRPTVGLLPEWQATDHQHGPRKESAGLALSQVTEMATLALAVLGEDGLGAQVAHLRP